MVDFNNLIDLQIEIFILMIIGYILRKINIISKENRKSLTDLVIYIILPANIIYSFMIKMDETIIKSGFTILIVSIVIQLGCQVFGKYFFIKIHSRQRSVLQYGTICSNAGFMGSPLIQGQLGLHNGILSHFKKKRKKKRKPNPQAPFLENHVLKQRGVALVK